MKKITSSELDSITHCVNTLLISYIEFLMRCVEPDVKPSHLHSMIKINKNTVYFSFAVLLGACDSSSKRSAPVLDGSMPPADATSLDKSTWPIMGTWIEEAEQYLDSDVVIESKMTFEPSRVMRTRSCTWSDGDKASATAISSIEVTIDTIRFLEDAQAEGNGASPEHGCEARLYKSFSIYRYRINEDTMTYWVPDGHFAPELRRLH